MYIVSFWKWSLVRDVAFRIKGEQNSSFCVKHQQKDQVTYSHTWSSTGFLFSGDQKRPLLFSPRAQCQCPLPGWKAPQEVAVSAGREETLLWFDWVEWPNFSCPQSQHDFLVTNGKQNNIRYNKAARKKMSQTYRSGLTFGSFHGFRDESSTGLVGLVKHTSGTSQAVGLLQHRPHI